MNPLLSLASFSTWQKPRRKILRKTIAVLLALCFIFPYLTWAVETQNYLGLNTFLFNQQPLEISKQLGNIDHVWQNNGPAVVYIQDLHCNYEVQKNIAAIIRYLAEKHGLRLLAVEGASLPINTTKLRSFPLAKIREEVSDYFVRKGKLSGAEYYAITAGQEMVLEGIETAELYARNKRTVDFILKDEGQGYCLDLREACESLKPRIYSSALSSHDQHCTAYRGGRSSVLQHCRYLFKAAGRLRLDRRPFTQMQTYLRSSQALFSPEINAEALFAEMDRLDLMIRESLYTLPLQRDLDECLRRLGLVEKLLNISVTPGELSEFRGQRQAFQVQTFIDFIRGQAGPDMVEIAPEVYMLDGYLNAAADFYRVADERSRHLAQNTLARMQKHGEQIAVLVTGGYHTEHVLAA
ncbi:hypothetical protein JW933_02490, partial [candidate division FCPU426 bacterium]|nr:hypothetical protein [candidate division FCPU426 bacterium]